MASEPVTTYFTDGMTAYANQEFAEAERLFSMAVSQSPENPNYLSYLGMVKQNLGKTEEAKEIIEKALTLIPTSVPLHYTLGELTFQLGLHEHARSEFTFICKSNETDSEYWKALSHLNLGLLALESANIDEALTEISQAEDIARNLGDIGLISRISTEVERNGF